MKSYVSDLKDNLRTMNRQIGKLRGQMHQLKELVYTNKKQINSNLNLANKAKESNKDAMVILYRLPSQTIASRSRFKGLIF